MKTSNAVEIMHRRYIKGNRWRLACVKWERARIKWEQVNYWIEKVFE